MKQNRLSLSDVEWGTFKIKDLFETFIGTNGLQTYTGAYVPRKDLISSSTPRITVRETNNGIDSFSDSKNKNYKTYRNFISVSFMGSAFYHPYEASLDMKVHALIPKEFNLTKNLSLFIIRSLKNNTELSSYGNQLSSTDLPNKKILLPLDSKGQLNLKFMEDYIKQEQKEIAQKVISYYEQKMLETGFDLVGLGDVVWRNFKVGDLFDFEKKPSKGLNNLEITNDNGISYLGATNRNNGVLEFVEPRKTLIYNGNCIAFIRNGEGSMGYSIYKKEDFIATQDISVGYNANLEQYSGMFITTIADRVRGKYNFGYKRNQIRLENEILTLPVDQNGDPHWEYMSTFMKKLEVENLEKVLEYIYIYIYIYKLAISYESKLTPLHKKGWRDFWLEDIVTIKSGVRLTKASQIEGDIPFIGSTDNNNGITSFISNKNSSLDSNVLGVNYNGSVVENFYHPYQAIFSDDVKRVHWKDKERGNEYTYLFLKQAILQQKKKYAYGYKFNASRMRRQKIILPIDNTGKPDFEYMKSYMQIEKIKQCHAIIKHFQEMI